MREHQAGGPGTDDSDLGTHMSFLSSAERGGEVGDQIVGILDAD